MNQMKALAILGSIKPDVDRVQSSIAYINDLDPMSKKRLYVAINRCKIQPQVLQNVALCSDNEAWHREFSASNKTAQLRLNLVKRVMHLLDESCQEKGIEPLLLKGASLNLLYPTGTIRYSNDMDLWVECPKELWSLASILKQAGSRQNSSFFSTKNNNNNESPFYSGHWSNPFDS